MFIVKDDEVAKATIKALVIGNPGTGKTGFGTSGPRPLILLSERQGVPHVRDAARRLKRPCPPILVMESIADYRHVIRALHGDRTKPFVVVNDEGTVLLSLAEWPETVTIDSVTDVMDMIADEIRVQSPPKNGKDGLPVDSERFWNVMEDRGRKFIRSFRDLPFNVVFLALLAERGPKNEDDTTRPWVGPSMKMKKLEVAIMAAVNVVGITYRKRADKAGADGQREMIYGIATTGPDHMCLKPYRPLRDHEVMDFTSWVTRINGQEDGTEAPPPMDATIAPVTGGDVEAASDKPAATEAKADAKPAGEAVPEPVADAKGAATPAAADAKPAKPAKPDKK